MMTSKSNLALVITLISFLQCNSQVSNPPVYLKLEASYKLGAKNFFEKDLRYIKGLLDNDLYHVKRYSFLPRMIWSTGDLIILFDKFSGNLISYNTRSNAVQNLTNISADLKQQMVGSKHNLDLIDIYNNLLTFYDSEKMNVIIYSLKDGSKICSASISNAIGIRYERTDDTLRLYSYQYVLTTKNCVEHRRNKNKRIPINQDNLFIRLDNSLFYQSITDQIHSLEMGVNSLSQVKLDVIGEIPRDQYNLVHVSNEFYILASNSEKGLGEFVFIDRKSKKIHKKIKLDRNVLDNSLVDFYDAYSDYPSPDVDDPSSYVRMTSLGDKYYIFFQSEGVLKLYSFRL